MHAGTGTVTGPIYIFACRRCPCCKHHPLTLDRIVVERGALLEAAPYLKERGYRQVALVSDENTYRAAGGRLASELAAAGIRTVLAGAKPDAQGDVVADEAGLIRLMLDIPQEGTDALLAVGSGTLHDMVRFIAFKMGKPFISVPTAPSVDGFTSVGAPLIIGGEKITIPAIAPDAIFADLDVLIERRSLWWRRASATCSASTRRCSTGASAISFGTSRIVRPPRKLRSKRSSLASGARKRSRSEARRAYAF